MLLGNETLQRQLSGMLRRGVLSHCLLLTGPEGSGKSVLAQQIAMALECERPRGGMPCGGCAECRRVLHGIHPDVTDVDYDSVGKAAGYSKGQVAYIRAAVCADAAVKPNQGKKKLYHFLDADKLNTSSQNALLKLIEEPPAYGVFVLESRNPDLLLPTVRSRATELRLEPLPQPVLERELQSRFPECTAELRTHALRRCDGWLGQAVALVESGGGMSPEAEAILKAMAASRRRSAVLRACVPLEKYKRDQLLPILEQLREGIGEALAIRAGAPGMPERRSIADAVTARQLSAAADAVQTAIDRLNGNVSTAHIMGALSAALGR